MRQEDRGFCRLAPSPPTMRTRTHTVPATAATALVAVLVVGGLAAPALAARRAHPSAPAIRYAVALDANGNDHIDGFRIVYDRKVHHRPDTDGTYPFSVDGYTVTGVLGAQGRTVVVTVRESSGAPDIHAIPAITYTPTTDDPVIGADHIAAARQIETAIVALDADGDGYTVADGDCDDADASVHPGAADEPDLGQIDSNCDGIDGTAADAIFVAPDGNDAAAGTMAAPKRTIDAAVAAAASYLPPREVYAAAGVYDEGAGVALRSGVGIYGGYVDGHWNLRGTSGMTVIRGAPQAALADGATGVTLQLLSLSGQPATGPGADRSVYGLRVVNGSQVTLQNVRVTAAAARAGSPGQDGNSGGSGPADASALAGRDGTTVPFDSTACAHGASGAAGQGAPGYMGGSGGSGGSCARADGAAGEPGTGVSPIPAQGGAGGTALGTGRTGSGQDGQPGLAGIAGTGGTGGASDFDHADSTWTGEPGTYGTGGAPGAGGGGGGGGAAWTCSCYATAYLGAGGGGGGAGGLGGTGGGGGNGGGGSFAVYLWNSSITVAASTLVAGDGGAGGPGGAGGEGGTGGAGGRGGLSALAAYGEGGAGGAGGSGGSGGAGGGGAGGPSIGIFRGGTSTASVDDATLILYGVAGTGGSSAALGSSTGSTGQVGTVEPPLPVPTSPPA